jgi:hypothetical protein
MTLGTQGSWKPNDTIKSWKEGVHIPVRCAGGDARRSDWGRNERGP